MNKTARIQFILGLLLLTVFAAYTMSLTVADLRPIGPNGSMVAYAGINQWFWDLIGVNWALYHITDWAGVAAILIALGFGAQGLVQWIGRKSIWKVDPGLLALGALYVLVFGVYVFFEYCVINYRPVLIGGVLEPSYPSSTTMLAMCVLPTAMIRFRRQIGNCRIRKAVNLALGLFTAFMVAGRLLSGVHWVTDILGGSLFSGSVILLYSAADRSLQSDNSPRFAGTGGACGFRDYAGCAIGVDDRSVRITRILSDTDCIRSVYTSFTTL